MINRKGKILTFFVLVNLLFTNIIVDATTKEFETKDKTLDDDYKRDSFYMKSSGEINDISIAIPIINPDFDIIAFIAFRNMTIGSIPNINDANLTINMNLNFENTSSDLMITVYGYKSDLGTGSFGDILITNSPPITNSHTNVNLQNITSEQLININVKEIMQEIISYGGYWNDGDTMGFIIYATKNSISRSYQSNYAIKKPSLTVTYNEGVDLPSELEDAGEFDYNQTYKGYDIFEGYPGSRVLIFSDYVNNTEFILTYEYIYSPYTDEYEANLKTKYVLPFNHDIVSGCLVSQGTIRNDFLVIGNEIWILSDTGSTRQLMLYKSPDYGGNWTLMHTFTYTGGDYPGGYTMEYNHNNGLIYIAFRRPTSYDVQFCSFNIETNETVAPSSIIQCQYSLYDVSLEVDPDTDNLYLGVTGGVAQSTPSFRFKQRINNVWSSTFNMENAYLTGMVDVDLYWNPTNNKLYAVCRGLDYSGTSEQQVMLYDKEEAYNSWGNWLNYILDMSTGNKQVMCSVMNNNTGVIVAIHNRGTSYIFDLSRTYYPYDDYTGVSGTWSSDIFYNGLIYLGPVKKESGFVNATEKTFFQLLVKDSTHAIYSVGPPTYWGVGDYFYTHNNRISTLSIPSDPFGKYAVYVYLNGTLIDEYKSIDDAKDYVDENTEINPLDPIPPGWEDETVFTRMRIRLVLFWMGYVLIAGPIYYLALVKGSEKMWALFISLFLIVIGVAFLMFIKQI